MWVAIIAALPATATFVNSLRHSSELKNISVQIDGRLTDLLRVSKEASAAEGKMQGITQEQDRVAAEKASDSKIV